MGGGVGKWVGGVVGVGRRAVGGWMVNKKLVGW